MNCSNAVDTQRIVNQINDLSATGRVHKGPLAQALKEVRAAAHKLAEFRPEQARQLAAGVEKAVATLSAQDSSMREKKTRSLRQLAQRLDACFSHSMDKAGKSIETYCQGQVDIPDMIAHQESRIEGKHQARIDALRGYLGDIRVSAAEREHLSQSLQKLDARFTSLLEAGEFAHADKQIAQEHYKTPTTTQDKGFDGYSSDAVFSDKEAWRRFGGTISKHQDYGRSQYVVTSKKVYTPARAQGKIWTQFRELAEQRRFAQRALSRHPSDTESAVQRIRLEIKSEKAAWRAELEALQTIVNEKRVQLRVNLDEAGAQVDALRQARDVLSRSLPS